MSSPTCAALLVIAACVVLQALGLSLQLHPGNGRACLQQHRQALVCLAWAPAVESPARAG
ncbi:hypothetical protein D7U87_03650 [Stenotrophomonas maltophilia]|jgi:hypothetical protein|uniref:Uncharacterized protein n=2 Tax=Stenotrophomonas TaxID=40323 RepID=A0AA40Y7P4_STEMA|nr:MULTISPECIES: hypothetical protein [Stenotrophomonas]AWB79388.1 hypothetical protein B7H26_16290 [Stenotrophomonas maltophilia]KDE90352.1 hypothetical protein DF40_019035 [Stenotrophomonas maltophilia M30]NEY37282.1 hypothetical protein [Streptomyces harenosi]CCH13617.1 hypothetical protein SMD_3096 [Stenotrophomonas maltophilia D457]KKF86984.1 hypothetical protein XY58_16670 [Stenotrophomonas maltophilia]